MTKKYVLIVGLLISLIATPLFANLSYDVELKGSSSPEVKVSTSILYQMPLLQGNDMFTQNNNLKLKATLGVSPITATFDLKAIFTPAAFAEISAGGTLGTGWNISEDLKGSLINRSGIVEDKLFGKLFTKGHGGVALQFDTAAFLKSKWQSIFARVYQEVSYQTLQTADNDMWNFESSGYREKGGFYHAEYIVGYNMPIIVNKVALMLETDINNFGSTLKTPILLTLSAIANLEVMDGLNITIIGQFTDKNNEDTSKATQKGPFGFSKVAGIVKYNF
ncbi:MAG: hypothetical protein ACOXZZ_03240 [Sphaerochaetaceae bacterium]|jgi:hypothetical protein